MGDETASWYAGDIYAFGITALQLTYGSTPPFNLKNIILDKQTINISTELYEKKCPFSKSFENLIKQCCAKKQLRISTNNLIKHPFFKKKSRSKCDEVILWTHSQINRKENQFLFIRSALHDQQ